MHLIECLIVREVFVLFRLYYANLSVQLQVSDELLFALAASGIRIEPILAPDLRRAYADDNEIQQVLLNLIMNAFEAMGETPLSERRVIVRSERISDGRVRVSVRDFGTGLLVDNSDRIFEHFFSTKQNGLGMGLAIVRSIVTAHDGELGAVNAEGGGTCAYFSLPGIGEGNT